MKTKGNWVIRTSTGLYWCGQNLFGEQIRKAQIYRWKEAAEEQAAYLWKRNKIENVTWKVIAVVEPKELKDTEAEWIKIEAALAETKYVCSACDFNITSWFGIHEEYICERSVLMMRFCPHCGKRMINSTMSEEADV